MDFDRIRIIKVSSAALETPVLKPILSANAKECFLAQEHKIQTVLVEKLPRNLRHCLSKNNSFPWKWTLPLTLSC